MEIKEKSLGFHGLKDKLRKEGFKFDDHSGLMDGDPVYILDIYGHKNQSGQVRAMADSWFNFKGEVNRIIDFYKKARGRKVYA